MKRSSSKPLLVVGAGIAGVTAALEAAETGGEVVLVEREPSIGGRVLRNHNYFPKLCPPSCGMEINTQRIERNPRLRVITSASVTAATKAADGWSVTVSAKPAYVNDKCTACGDCVAVCPAKIKDSFNLDMCETSAIHIPHQKAWPQRFVIERSACPDGCKACVDACKYSAIDLDAKATEETVDVEGVILATGWKPYPLENLDDLGGDLPDVISNVQMERMVAQEGPTAGKIQKLSNGEAPKKVAFVQCAGSRDVNHLPYCSGVCCMASLKQAVYVKEQLPDAEVTIFYIDRRSPGRNEDMLTTVAAMEGVKLMKGKVGKVEQGPGVIKLRAEDVESGRIIEAEADLVVLATGMVPHLKDGDLPFDLKTDEDGFGLDSAGSVVFVAGVARRPEDVAATTRDATGTVAKTYIAAARRA
jgi:quinone-modifying oxidoreductase subunit QmoA